MVTLRPFNDDSAAAKRNRDQAGVDASGHNERRSTKGTGFGNGASDSAISECDGSVD